MYIFALLYYLTNQGTNIQLAQWIFAALYLLNLSVVLLIYRRVVKVHIFDKLCIDSVYVATLILTDCKISTLPTAVFELHCI